MSEDGPLYHEPRLRRRQSDAFVAFPQKALHVAFSGQLLHGVPGVLEHSRGERLALLVNVWLHHRPIGLERCGAEPTERGGRLPNNSPGRSLCFRPKRGSETVSLPMTSLFSHLRCVQVTSVTTEADGVWVACGESKSFRCLRCVFATPPKQLGNVKFAPALPSSRAALHTSVFIGCIIKAVFRYGRPFWRLNGFSGEVVAEATDDEPCFNCYDHCVGDCHMLVCFLNGSPARTWSLRTQADFVSGGIAFDHRLICHPGIGTIWRLCEFEVSPK
eukprot:g15702.t1